MSNQISDPIYANLSWILSDGCSYVPATLSQAGKNALEGRFIATIFPSPSQNTVAHGQYITLASVEARTLRWWVRKTDSSGGTTGVKMFVRVFDGMANSPDIIIGAVPLAETLVAYSSLSSDWTEYSMTVTPVASNITLNAGLLYDAGGTPNFEHAVEFDKWSLLKTEEEPGYKTPISNLDYPENGPGPNRFRVTEVDEIHGTMHKEGDFQIDHDLLVRNASDEVSRDREDLLEWRAPNRRSFREP